MTKLKTRVAAVAGDGIGPEIMSAVLRILDAAEADVQPVWIEAGEKVYLRGESSGIGSLAWQQLSQMPVMLKGPITTPQGGGYKSLNVTLRKTLGLFANVRPCRSLHPYVPTHFPSMDMVIIRENEEDLYAGIEHQQTDDVVQCLKLITRPGCERIVRYAFEYARANGRRTVTCMTKDNIMKQTDGLFHKVFDEIGKEYPEIRQQHMIVDIGAARLAVQPEKFDVVVTLNLYGDILSDIVAETAGSVGMAGSANIGQNFAMFEAIHGSAPDIAGRDIANPSGLLNAAVMMLLHLGQHAVAARIGNAWLRTLEDGIHTADIYREGVSMEKVGTQAFADAVIARLGQTPLHFETISFPADAPEIHIPEYVRHQSTRELVGVDVFLCDTRPAPESLGRELEYVASEGLKLKMISNRGVKVYPDGQASTFCTDHWRCRFVSRNTYLHFEEVTYRKVHYEEVIALLQKLQNAGLEVIKTENLYLLDGKRAFSLGQGE
jgi:isocitrate dehydrogenase